MEDLPEESKAHDDRAELEFESIKLE